MLLDLSISPYHLRKCDFISLSYALRISSDQLLNKRLKTFFRLATSIISMIIFAYELHEKWCFTKLPWSMLEFLFPIFMVLLLCAASIVGLITASLRFGDDGLEYYNRACIAASVLGLLDCIPWGLQAFFQYSINNS